MKNKLSLVRLISVVVAAIGGIMLAVGLVLSVFAADRKNAANGAEMPEKYIEEFFSDDDNGGYAQRYIDPEYNWSEYDELEKNEPKGNNDSEGSESGDAASK